MDDGWTSLIVPITGFIWNAAHEPLMWWLALGMLIAFAALSLLAQQRFPFAGRLSLLGATVVFAIMLSGALFLLMGDVTVGVA